MRRRSIIRLYSTAYLSLLLSTLILCAALFAIHSKADDRFAYEGRPTSESHSEQEVKGRERTFLTFGAEGWTAIFTGGLFAFTMLLARYTYKLFEVTQAGILEQGRLTDAAVNQARRSADAALAASRAHIRTARVLVDANNIYNGIASDENYYNISFISEIVNYGKTPADVARIRLGFVAKDINFHQSKKAWPESDRLFWPARTLKEGAKDSVSQTISVPITGPMRNAILRKQLHIFARLEIFYFDVFGTEQVEDVIWRVVSVEGGRRIILPHAINRTEPQE